MIISLNRRFVFVHIHKCAGTSVEVALAPLLTVNDLLIGSTPEGEKHKRLLGDMLGLHKHSAAAAAKQALGAVSWAGFYSFAFVRHPVDRLHSLYTYARGLIARKPMSAQEAEALAATGQWPNRAPYKFKAAQAAFSNDSFDGFLRDPRCWKDDGAKPQWKSLYDAEGECLVNFVGRVEHIDQDWDTVQRKLGVSVALGRQNRSLRACDGTPAPLTPQAPPSHEGWREDQLSAQAWAMIHRHCMRDFRVFGYPPPEALLRTANSLRSAKRAAPPLANAETPPLGTAV